MGDLVKRLGTAAVLVPALLVAILLDPTPWSVVVFAAAVSAVSFDEFLRMSLPVTDTDRALGLRVVAAIGGTAIVVMPSLFEPGAVWPPLLAGSALALALAVLARAHALEHAGRHFAACLAGLVYVPFMMSHLPLLKSTGKPHWLVVTLCTAFFADTVAYFFGRAWGKHKLYEAVSPKKTWEGSLGGVIGSVLATVGVGALWTLPDLAIVPAILLGVVASVCGQSGDLVESMLKRTFGVKDSGSLLPGHGGMLDRIDALLFVAPIVYYFILWFG